MTPLAVNKSSSVQVLGHTGHDVSWTLRTSSHAELWDMVAKWRMVVKGIYNHRKVLTDGAQATHGIRTVDSYGVAPVLSPDYYK